LFNREGLFFNHYERSELLDLYHQSEFRQAGNREMQGIQTDYETAMERHMRRVLQHVDLGRVRARRFRVALDSVNGAGSVMSVRFLRDVLGCELAAIHTDITRPFPREPEPKPESLAGLRALILDNKADVGFAQDPDGDRLAVGDETGRILDNDDVLALAVDCALRRKPGPVVVNLTTSAAIEEVAARYGCPVQRAPVGEANVVEQMKAAGAVIGGEGSNGGIIFPAVQYCRDSYLGMALLLDRMAETGQQMSELAATLPRFHRKFGKIPYSHGMLGPMMQRLEARFPKARMDRTDGLKILLQNGWIHLRASNTEPLVRVAAEARTQDEVEELYRAAAGLAEQG
jgi:phosphomannomutase